MKRSSFIIYPLLFFTCALVWADPIVSLESVADGFSQPVFVDEPPDDSGRLFVVEQAGVIRIISQGNVLSPPFLDISSRVTSGGERGLLGLAFHPNYIQNGRFFVNYTRTEAGQLQTVVAEYQVSSSDPNRASLNEEILLTIDQPFSNHNGGMIAFGQDGYFYVATGDGGSGGDPQGNAQDLGSLLGKMLRINVDGASPYQIPAGNPFAGVEGAQGEIWAYGLRNPWRFSFDRTTGRLFAGDVGQNAWEEVDLITKGSNYGWNILEGTHCFSPPENCDREGTVLPIAEYGHGEGVSVTGGYVYRGRQSTPLWGAYLFADYVSGTIWALEEMPGGSWKRTELLRTDRLISSFGENERGELYLVDRAAGEVLKIIFSWRQVFPHAGFGSSPAGDFVSRLILANSGPSSVAGTIRFITQGGETITVGVNNLKREEHTFEIPGGEAVSFTTDLVDDSLQVGWLEVVSDAPLTGSILFQLKNGGEVLAEAGIASSEPAPRLVGFLQRDLLNGLDSGIAVANPSIFATANVEVRFLSAQGLLEDEFQFSLAPSEQRAFFPDGVGTIPTDFEGTIVISAGQDISALLLTTVNGVHSASLPLSSSGD